MASSNVARGNYYYKKTVQHYEDLGYKCTKMEAMTTYFHGGTIRYTKRDILFSDMMIYNKDEIALVQVKGGKSVGTSEAVKNYKALREEIPPHLKLIVILWRPRVKIPKIIEV